MEVRNDAAKSGTRCVCTAIVSCFIKIDGEAGSSNVYVCLIAVFLVRCKITFAFCFKCVDANE